MQDDFVACQSKQATKRRRKLTGPVAHFELQTDKQVLLTITLKKNLHVSLSLEASSRQKQGAKLRQEENSFTADKDGRLKTPMEKSWPCEAQAI